MPAMGMKTRWSVAAGLSCAVLVTVACSSTVPEVDVNWAFLGVYEIGNITELEGAAPDVDVRVDLRVEVTSYGADIKDAVLALRDTFQPDRSYGDVRQIQLAVGMPTVIRQVFTIPRQEYDAWLAGAMPRVDVEFRDAAGQVVRSPVPMMPGTVREEG